MKTAFEELKATGRLPSPGGVGMAVLRLTAQEDFSTEDLVKTVQADGALTGRLLRMANGAKAAGVQSITTVEVATMRLGATAVRNVALGFSLMSGNRTGTCTSFDYDAYWSESLLRAVLAQALSGFAKGLQPPEGFVCGLLSRIGELALATTHAGPYAAILDATRGKSRAVAIEAERSAFQIDRDEVSKAMLAEWGLPPTYAAAVAAAEDVVTGSGVSTTLTGVLQAACRIASATLGSPSVRAAAYPKAVATTAALGMTIPEFHGLATRAVDAWREWGSMLNIPIPSTPTIAEVEQEVRTGLPTLAPHGSEPAAPTTDPVAKVGAGTRSLIPPNRPKLGTPPSFLAATPGSTRKIEPPPNGLLILAVDDDKFSLHLLQKELEKAGHAVLTAHNGKEGLRIALEVNPQVVITDWKMPEMDGIDLCKALRRCESGREMYVLVLTGSEEEDHLVSAFEAGADDYVTKPWKPRVLLARTHAAQRVVRLQQQVAKDRGEMQRHVAELGVLARRLEKAALTDPLTGLANRRFAMEHLAVEWERSVADGGPLGMIMLDIDHFKKVNDEFGHDTGDLVLTASAQVLSANRKQGEEVCRVGGEEFVVICPGANVEQTLASAERLRAAVERNVIRGLGFNRAVTISLGVAARTPDMAQHEALLKAADIAVYEAKHVGRNRVALYQPQPVTSPV